MPDIGMPLVQLVNRLPLAKIKHSSLICHIMVPIVPNGSNVKVEWYQQNYSECSQCQGNACSVLVFSSSNDGALPLGILYPILTY
jgi:hypothetical protein